MTNPTFTRDTLRDIIAANRGRFFSVTWTTKNGETIKRVCRTGVKKYLANPDNPQAPTTAHLPEYVTVYAMGRGYRAVNLDTVTAINCRRMAVKKEAENVDITPRA